MMFDRAASENQSYPHCVVGFVLDGLTSAQFIAVVPSVKTAPGTDKATGEAVPQK